MIERLVVRAWWARPNRWKRGGAAVDPEAMFQKLDSGSPGSLRELALALYRHADRTDRVADRISHATLVPVWEGFMAHTFRTVGNKSSAPPTS